MVERENLFLTFKQKLYPFGFRHDAWIIIKRAFAFAVSYVFTTWTIPVVSLIFVSQLGPQQRDGCALAFEIYTLVSNAILTGVNFGCDTLLPQCFGGNKQKMGVIVQRATIIVIFTCFPIWILMLNAKYLLQFLEQDTDVVNITNQFLQIYIIVVPFDGLASILRMYIGSTGRTKIFILMNIIGNLVNALAHYICLYLLKTGIRGVPIAIFLAYFSVVCTAIIYIRFSAMYKETWYPITRACLQEWNMYLKLALPGVILMIVQIWSVSLADLFAAPLGIRSLSAQVVLDEISWLFYLLTQAVSDAGDVLIGEYLGANKPMQAVNAKNVTYTLAIIQSILNAIFIVITHYWTPLLFNTEPDALPLARSALLVVAIFCMIDGLNIVQIGIVKSCGMQRYGAMFLFIGFYVIGLPLAYMLMYVFHMDIYGFWIGVSLGDIVIDILLFILIWNLHWNTHSKEAEENIRFNHSLIDTDESMKLLSDVPDRTYNPVPIQDDYEKENLIKKESNESLFKLIRIKLLVLISFICLFIISLINSVK